MKGTISLKNSIIIFGIPALLIATVIWIATTYEYKPYPDSLAIGITLDLLLTIPVLYFLLIRKTRISNKTVFPVLVLGLVIGSAILPSENQQYLNLFKRWIFPILELTMISFVVYKISKTVKQYKLNKEESSDFFTALKITCYEILPKVAAITLVTEIAAFYYGFLHWKKRPLKENEFSYHKESGSVALLLVILFMIVIETMVLHMLLVQWSEVLAWSLTFVSIYSSFQIFGFLRSMSKRPISIQNRRLYLRYGIMNEAIIDIAEIQSIEISSKDIDTDEETRKFTFLGDLEGHNIIIRLRKENTLTGLYGIKRKFKVLALHVDQKDRFYDRINDVLLQDI